MFISVFIESIFLTAIFEYMNNKTQRKSEQQLEKALQNTEDKLERNLNAIKTMLKSQETWTFGIKEELKDEMRGLFDAYQSKSGNKSP